MGIAMKLSDYLKANEVQCEVLSHSHSGNSMQPAKASNVPARCVAKAVALEDGTHAVLAELSASRRLARPQARDRGEAEISAQGLRTGGGAAAGRRLWPGNRLGRQPPGAVRHLLRGGRPRDAGAYETRDFIGLMKGARHMTFSAQTDKERRPLF